MARTVQRTIGYSLANWLSAPDEGLNLSRMIRSALSDKPSVENTEFRRPDGSYIDISHRRVDETDDVYLDITVYDPDRANSTVPHLDRKNENRELSEASAPIDHSFLQGSAIVMLSGDHVLLAADKVRLSSIETYLRELIREKHGEKNSRFILRNVANKDIVSRIDQGEVESIGLDTALSENMYQTSIISSRSSDLLQRLKSFTADLLSEDEDLGDIYAGDYSNINASLTVKRFSKSRFGVTQNHFNKVAVDLVNDKEPGLFIKLKGGAQITHDEIKLSRSVKVTVIKERHSYLELWAHMQEYHSELKAMGYLA